MNVIASVVGLLLGAALSLLSEPVSRHLLEKRGKEFKPQKVTRILQTVISSLLAGMIGWVAGFSLQSLFLLSLLYVGNIISTTDIQYRLIPNDTVLLLLGTKLVFGILALLKVGGLPSWNPLLSLAGLAVLGVIFFLPGVLGGKVGMGDVKLAMAIGFCAELMPALIAICLMGVLVLIYGFLQRSYSLMAFLKINFPMGPFLCAAQLLALLINLI